MFTIHVIEENSFKTILKKLIFPMHQKCLGKRQTFVTEYAATYYWKSNIIKKDL